MSKPVILAFAGAPEADVSALRLYRQVLELQRQVGLLQAAARDLVLASAAAGVPPASSSTPPPSIDSRLPPADASRSTPPPPVGPRSAVAVDNSRTRKRNATPKVTERTTPLKTTRTNARRQVRTLDLDAANDELASCTRRSHF